MKHLCLALTTYDYCHAPSNWQPELKHEKIIWDWAEWCLEEEEEQSFHVIGVYLQNKVPDAYDLMEDYFC